MVPHHAAPGGAFFLTLFPGVVLFLSYLTTKGMGARLLSPGARTVRWPQYPHPTHNALRPQIWLPPPPAPQAKAEGIVTHVSNLFDTFFDGGKEHRLEKPSITQLPYFEVGGAWRWRWWDVVGRACGVGVGGWEGGW